MADFATENLAYFEGTGLVYLRAHGDADDEVCIGGIDSILACPREYRGEFRSLLADVREARLFDAACRSEAGAAYYGRMDPWRW